MTCAVEKASTVKVLRWTSSADNEPCLGRNAQQAVVKVKELLFHGHPESR